MNSIKNRIVFYLSLFLALHLYSCDATPEPYLKHSMQKPEKLAGNCNDYDPKFTMVSNVIGERYEFQKCLHATYDGHYTAERKGDTVEVKFQKLAGPEALYKITLDINTYPRYNYLTIDGNTFGIIPAGN